jgi:CubicO group peptidase (beta-lactamase class C family)
MNTPPLRFFATWAAACGLTCTLPADLPISGRPVPALAAIDTAVSNYLIQHGYKAAVVGILHDGRIVYLRGFGYLSDPAVAGDATGVPLPENAMFRTASVTKPMTAAAIRWLGNNGYFGPAGMDRRAFRLTVNGVNNDGVLAVTPWPFGVLADSRHADITVRHLLNHAAGFNRAAHPFDPMFRTRTIMEAYALTNRVPTNAEVMGYMLAHSLAWAPGAVSVTTSNLDSETEDPYSNFGYMVLGEIANAVYPGGLLAVLRERILTPAMGVPVTEYRQGNTLANARQPREPRYDDLVLTASVYPPHEPVFRPYGGFHFPAMLAHGGLIASGPAMLEFVRRYELWHPFSGAPTAGEPRGGTHNGVLDGLNTILSPIGQGRAVWIAVNSRRTADHDNDPTTPARRPADALLTIVTSAIAMVSSWPATTSDGFWVQLGAENPSAGFGGYHSPFHGFGSAMGRTTTGSKIRLKPGTSLWTGTLDRAMHFDAPEGSARVGGN